MRRTATRSVLASSMGQPNDDSIEVKRASPSDSSNDED